MKVIYYSYPFFADCDFPLIKSLQDRGVDVRYYMPLHRNFQRSSILEFKRPLRKMGFVKASRLEEMQVYKDCIDLDRLYFIKAYPLNIFWIPSWLLWVYTLWHMKRQKADIIHIDWQFNNNHFEKFLFKFSLGKRRVMTVHDPIMHSGQPNALIEEQKRILSFRWAEHFILLNKVQTHDFSEKYSIPLERISFSQLPNYDSISKISPLLPDMDGDYILFFGQIKPYKGLDLLLDAMLKVHEICPNLKLVVAGDGRLHFDGSKYENLDYIIWIHRYVGIRELAGLLKNCSFVVCPYKDATQSGVAQTAFAMHVPVIASNVGNFAVDIKQNLNGLLVQPNDKDALSESIMSLYNNNPLLQSMCNYITENRESDIRKEKITDNYVQVYSCMANH